MPYRASKQVSISSFAVFTGLRPKLYYERQSVVIIGGIVGKLRVGQKAAVQLLDIGESVAVKLQVSLCGDSPRSASCR